MGQKNNFDAIIHLAAIVPIKTVNKNRTKAKNVNFYGTKNIVDACVKSKIDWFFFLQRLTFITHPKRKFLKVFLPSLFHFMERLNCKLKNILLKN